MQMLGERIDDPVGVDGSAEGLRLLPIRTTFAAVKRTERTTTRFNSLPEPWAKLGGLAVSGYEIRHGATTTTGALAEALPGSLGFVAGPILGVYVHGLFEQPDVVAAVIGTMPLRSLEQTFDQLGDAVEEHLDLTGLLESIGI
jgi:adenosylcobyric acid synthase